MKQQNLVRGDSQPIWSLAILTCIRYQYFLQYTIPASSCLKLTIIIHLYYQISFLQKGINEDIQWFQMKLM